MPFPKSWGNAMKEQICSHIPTECPWGENIQVFDTIDSTNTRLKEMARAGVPEGTVLLSHSQTGGRGRLGRSFHSPKNKGIYFSLLLRPGVPASQMMHLTCAVGVAVCDAVEAVMDFRPGIKWINDLVAGRKKVGGILTELSIDPEGTVTAAVIGIGINCCHSREDFPPELQDIATSLQAHTGRHCDQSRLVAALICELYRMRKTLISGKGAVMERYRKDCITIGKEIQVIRDAQWRPGLAADVLEDGQLLVRYPDGTQEPVDSGEVSIRGMYGYIS